MTPFAFHPCFSRRRKSTEAMHAEKEGRKDVATPYCILTYPSTTSIHYSLAACLPACLPASTTATSAAVKKQKKRGKKKIKLY